MAVMELQKGLKITLTELADFCQTHTVVGQPVHIGEITLVPFIEVLFGVAGGSPVAAGARIAPSSVLVVRGEEITLFPLRDKSALDKAIEIIPEIIKKLPQSQ